MKKTGKMSVDKLATGAVLTALVIILQLLGQFIKFGPFSISLVLIPIVIGTATCGKEIGAWLGFVFGMVVLLNGDATAFMTINAPGTIATVLLKGIACGYVAGLVYEFSLKLFKGDVFVSTYLSAIVCPIVNTAVFILGCLAFFMGEISKWAAASTDFSGGAIKYIFLVLVGGNFLFEFLVNVALAPIIVRILKAVKKGK